MASTLIPNYPQVANSSSCGCNGNCSCSSSDLDFGDIFSDRALYKINKNDSLCDSYDKINANFKMLSDGFLLLAKALTSKDLVRFGANLPISCQGPFFYSTTNQKLYVWNETLSKYIAAYGTNSVNDDPETLGEDYVPNNQIPTLANLRNIADGVETNHFTNTFGEMVVTFVETTPSCSVGLFIFDKSDHLLKVWSPGDEEYIPAYSCLSVTPTNTESPEFTGKSYETVKRRGNNVIL